MGCGSGACAWQRFRGLVDDGKAYQAIAKPGCAKCPSSAGRARIGSDRRPLQQVPIEHPLGYGCSVLRSSGSDDQTVVLTECSSELAYAW
jgi:hypothetical protein